MNEETDDNNGIGEAKPWGSVFDDMDLHNCRSFFIGF